MHENNDPHEQWGFHSVHLQADYFRLFISLLIINSIDLVYRLPQYFDFDRLYGNEVCTSSPDMVLQSHESWQFPPKSPDHLHRHPRNQPDRERTGRSESHRKCSQRCLMCIANNELPFEQTDKQETKQQNSNEILSLSKQATTTRGPWATSLTWENSSNQ